MKRICINCNVVSADANRWCQEKHCPAEQASEIYDNGEWFGPIQIVEPLVVTRSAILYRARRENKPILVKIANEGCEKKLKREARAFLQLARAGQHPSLPVLLPAHIEGTVDQHPFGWTVIHGKPKYFMIFEDVQGETLRAWLLKNPQPWYRHAGWIVMQAGDVILHLQNNDPQKLHLCLNPDMLLLRFDSQGTPRPILLDLGIGRGENGETNPHQLWEDSNNLPAYSAPELLNPRERVTPAADVYGLGLLLYEMLAGQPAFPYRLKKDQQVVREVLQGSPPDPNRPDLNDLNAPLPRLAMLATRREASQRQPNIQTFVTQVYEIVGKLPEEKKSWRQKYFHWLTWKVFFIVLGALLLLSLLVVLAVNLANLS